MSSNIDQIYSISCNEMPNTIVRLAAVFCTGNNMIIAQGYSLMYRWLILHNNKRLHTVFMSIQFKLAWFLFSQTVSAYIAIFVYRTLMTQEVRICKINFD